MARKLIIAGAILVVAAIAVKKLHLDGYAYSAWAAVQEEVRNHIPTKVEFNRLEHEIARLDGDIQNLADPLAELDFDIKQHKREIEVISNSMNRGRKILSNWVDELKAGSEFVIYRGREYSRRQMNQKVSDAFANLKRLEAEVKTKNQLVDAKRKRFDAIYGQAEKLAAKKREFTVRLAHLRTKLEERKAQEIAQRPVRGSGRVEEIDVALRRMEKREHKLSLKNTILQSEPFATEDTPNTERQVPQPNLDEIRNYLNGSPAAVKRD